MAKKREKPVTMVLEVKQDVRRMWDHDGDAVVMPSSLTPAFRCNGNDFVYVLRVLHNDIINGMMAFEW